MLKSFHKFILDNNVRDYSTFSHSINTIQSPKLKGDHFECFVFYILKLHPFYGHKHVYFQKDIPPSLNDKYQLPETDKGFDLLSIDNDDQIYGIQAKYRKDIDTVIAFGELSTTPGLAFVKNINNLIFFTNCLDVCKELKNNAKIINVCGSFWDTVDQENIFEKIHNIISQKQLFVLKKKVPRDYQTTVIQKAQQHYTQYTSGINHMACGTGKTLVAYWIAQEYQFVVVCVPSLILLSQFFREWYKESNIQSLLVGSDFNSDENTGMILTTSSEKITGWLSKLGKKWIFTTYQSNHLVKEALSAVGITADITIYDEAHKLVNSEWSNALQIPTQKKLFMTATLKYYKGANDDVIDMNSEIFGEIINTINLRQAINMKCVSDYRLMTLVSSNDFFKRADCILENEKTYPKWLVGSVILLAKTLEKYIEIKKIISYHNTCEEAKQFQLLLEHRGIRGFYMDGLMTMKKRQKIIKEFEMGGRAVICSAKVLQEGIDLPFVDTCMYVSPKNSVIDIIQSACRCMRLYNGKQLATIIVCTPVDTDKETNQEVCLNSAYQPLWNVVRALSSCDANIKAYFKDSKNNVGGFNFVMEGDEIVKKYIDFPEFEANIGLKFWDKLIDTTDRFNNWYEAVTLNDGLVAQKYSYNGFNTGEFQSNYIKAMAGRNDFYKAKLETWQKQLNQLSPKILHELELKIKLSKESHVKIKITPHDRFNAWIEKITINKGLIKSDCIYNNIRIGDFQAEIVRELSNNMQDSYDLDTINIWKTKIKELDQNIQNELAKKINNYEHSKVVPCFTTQERFDIWYEEVKKNNGLIDNKLVINQMNIGLFQTNLMGALSGRAPKYQEYLEKWNIDIDKLPEIIVKKIRNKMEASIERCNNETITSNDRFEIWFNEVVKNNALLPYTYTYNELKIGEFQTSLLSIVNGYKTGYKNEIDAWKLKINTLDKKIITKINDRKDEAKTRKKPLSPKQLFDLWLIEVSKTKTLVAATYVKDGARIGPFQGRLIKNIAGIETIYKKMLPKWNIEIDKFPEIKTELNKQVEILKPKQTDKKITEDERFNAWYLAVKNQKKLVSANYLYNGINLGAFQYCLIGALAEKLTYKKSIDRWEKEIKLLDKVIQIELTDKIENYAIRKKNPSISSQDRFDTWYETVKELDGLVEYNTKINEIDIGSFQDCLIRSLANRSNYYKEDLPNWKEKISLLSEKITTDLQILVAVSKSKMPIKIV